MSEKEAVKVFQEWLDGYLDFERLPQKNIFWLDTIKFLCKRFGNPQNASPCFHVAGSKGKGSVSKMIACILEEAGLSCGLYTSPHIIDFRERIGTALDFFPESIYESAIREMVPRIESIIPEELPGGRSITWFEIVTLFAFLCFRHAKVDYSVYEVGMGGRLDATNVVTPRVCCITPIELEHTEYLGDTLEKIAGEKAGIIKKDVPVIVAAQQTEAVRDVFRKKAAEIGTVCNFVDDLTTSIDYSYSTGYVSAAESGGRITCGMHVHIESNLFTRPVDTVLQLLGSIQARNAAQAAFAVKTVFPNINESVIEKGLSKAVLPGRFEITYTKKYPKLNYLILDGAHTVNSIRYTIETLKKLFAGSTLHLLFACAADKDVLDIAPLFKGLFSHITLTRPGGTKHSDIEKEKSAFTGACLTFTADTDFSQAIPAALLQAENKNAVLLVTGSFYLVAEVKKYIN
ncbi:MAG: folylpolyglutamate synthase/dihydrofolate synthase family protein [Treponema sp.]